MKRSARFVCFALALVMLLGIAIGCSDATETDVTTEAQAATETPEAVTTVEEETKLTANIPDTKYNRTFTIASGFVTDTKYTTSLIVATETTGDVLNDALFRRTVLMEDKFGIDIEVLDANVNVVQKTVKSGEHSYDIGTAVLSEVTTVLTNGLGVDLNTVQEIDLSMPWWDQNAAERFTIKNKLFYTFSDFTITGIDNARCCYFSKDLAADLKITDLFDISKEGTWTFDKMREYCVLALNDNDGNGTIDTNDRVGIAEAATQFYEVVMCGCDMEPVKQGDDYLPYYSGDKETDKFVEVYTHMLDLFTKDNTYLVTGNTNALNMFKSGNSLFILYTLAECPKLRADSAVEFGILPVPKYNTDQENYLHVSPNGDALYIIPGSDEEVSFAGVMLEAGSYYSSSYYSDEALMPSYFDLCLATKNAPDVDSSTNLQIVHDNISYTMKVLGTDYMQSIYNLMEAKNYNISSTLATLNKRMTKLITKTLQGYGIDVE